MATSYLSPGVYIEEVDRGSKPIEAVGTSTCAFIGESSVGPTNEAVLVTNWAQYTRTFGDFQHSTLLPRRSSATSPRRPSRRSRLERTPRRRKPRRRRPPSRASPPPRQALPHRPPPLA